MTSQAQHDAATNAVNEVRLVGRLSAAPERRELPSGDAMVAFRLVVSRPKAARRGTQTVDALECAAWRAAVMRTATRWRVGDVVEVRGAVRRRFYRAGGRLLSSTEIEVEGGRIIRRAAPA